MKTLVIHPADPTTDYLKEGYSHLQDVTVISDARVSKRYLKELIRTHDRVVMMGHGDEHYGLYKEGDYVLSSSLTFWLRRMPDNIYIWCNANGYAYKKKLQGFITGMIVSEYDEALMYSLYPVRMQDIKDSNTLFAEALAKSIDFPPKEMYTMMKDLYKSDDNPIIQFNNQNLFVY